MSFYRSKVICSNIYLSPVGQDNASEEYPEAETGNGDNICSEDVLNLDVRWYSKASLLIDNIKKMLHHLGIWPSFAVYIDKMTNNFKGR